MAFRASISSFLPPSLFAFPVPSSFSSPPRELLWLRSALSRSCSQRSLYVRYSPSALTLSRFPVEYSLVLICSPCAASILRASFPTRTPPLSSSGCHLASCSVVPLLESKAASGLSQVQSFPHRLAALPTSLYLSVTLSTYSVKLLCFPSVKAGCGTSRSWDGPWQECWEPHCTRSLCRTS
jgi:hypothetical protein